MLRRDAWESFQYGNDPTSVSAQLLDSWRRSRWSGVDPVHTEVPVVDVDVDTPFVRAAAPVMLRTAETLGDTKICLALADARGSLVWRWASDPAFTRVLDAVRMSTGTNFEEELVGTNGIGTALESRELAGVIGPDHYCQAFHRWACVAAPIRDPATNKICGAVNVTSWASDANPFLLGMTQALADGVSQRLIELAHPRVRALLDAFVSGRARTTAPVLAVNAETMITDDVAGSWGLDHTAIWNAVSEMPPGSPGVVVREGLRAQVWPVGQDVVADGAVLALYPESADAAVAPVPAAAGARPGLGPLETAEADVIARVLAECKGNKTAAATRLHISRVTLYQKLRRYRLAWAPAQDKGGQC